MDYILDFLSSVGRTIVAIFLDFANFFWPPRHRQKFLRLGIPLLLIIVAGRFFLSPPEATVVSNEVLPTAVSLTSMADVAGTQAASFVGTVRGLSEASIQSEVAGRVTSLRVQPGDTVSAGAIIATLENASEQAAVLQAEGAYEQALANAAITGVSTAEADNAVRQTVDGIYNTAASTLTSLSAVRSDELDTLVADQNNVYRTGSVLLRADAALIYGLEERYRALEGELADLRAALNGPRDANSAREVLVLSRAALASVDVMTKNVRQLVQDEDLDEQFDPDEAAFLAALSSVETQANTQRSALRSVEGQLDAALEGRARAAIAGSGADVSVADAQVKTALGGLRAAQAQLAKTILRSPISGTVNSVDINLGDFIGSFTPVAQVANNGSLEVRFFVIEREAAQLSIGQGLLVDGTTEATIVSIAPAVDQATQKIEVRAAVTGNALTNGSTVQIALADKIATETETATSRFLPITAVRFTASDGFVFTVSEDSTLVAVPVTLGQIRGTTVEIIDGVTPTTLVVADARGLASGQPVTVTQN